MAWWRGLAGGAVSLAGALVIAAANTPLDVAQSNLATYLPLFGWATPPDWLYAPAADHWALGAGVVLLLAPWVWWAVRRFRRRPAAGPHVVWLPDSPPPHPRDMTACAAVAYIGLESSWGRKRGLGGLSFEAARELRQAALEGRLQVCGYQGKQWLPDEADVVWRPIPPSDWNDHKLDLTECDNPKSGGGATERASDYGIHVTRYTHLMVSRAQVEHLWPR